MHDLRAARKDLILTALVWRLLPIASLIVVVRHALLSSCRKFLRVRNVQPQKWRELQLLCDCKSDFLIVLEAVNRFAALRVILQSSSHRVVQARVVRRWAVHVY